MFNKEKSDQEIYKLLKDELMEAEDYLKKILEDACLKRLTKTIDNSEVNNF
jgi:hypothetical protein